MADPALPGPELAERELLRQLFDAMPQLGWTARPDGFIDYYNRGWYEYTGSSYDEMKGWGWQSVHDPAELPRVMESWTRSIATGKPWELEFPLRRADGCYRWFLSRATPIYDDHGALVRWVGINTDIDDQKRAERELAELDRAKTAFFSNVSHEFRTPLTLMLGPTEDLLAGAHGPVSAGVRQQLEVLLRNQLRLQRLVNALLDFSRTASGRQAAHVEPVELASLTEDIAGWFRAAIERAGLTFRVDCSPTVPPAFVDRTMWEQIVLNLLSNALKFTFSGSIEVTLRTDERWHELRIADTGVGIAAHELPRLFERFHRIEGSRARTHEGSGIGLALVHDLVTLHRGQITARSTPGAGTTFVVTIPRGSAHLSPEQLDTVPASEVRRGPAIQIQESMRWVADVTADGWPVPRESRVHLLVVDDNADMRDHLCRILAPEWAVATAADGLQALDAARARRPDLIVTDVMMPNLDGFGLLRALRAAPETRTIPVIMLSARAGPEARIEGLEAGADDYLIKPFSRQELIARVRTQLRLAQAQAALERRWLDLLALLDQVPVAVALVREPERRYEYVNQAHVDLAGRRLTGMTLAEALAHADAGGRPPAFDLVLLDAAASAPLHEVAVTTPDGATRFLSGRAAVWLDHEGTAQGSFTVATDVTSQVVARRETERAHQQVVRSEAALLEARNARDQFVALAAHELRTPLTTMSLQLDAFARELAAPGDGAPAPALIGRRVERMRGQVSRFELLAENMISALRLGQAVIEPGRAPLDLAELTRAAVDRVRSQWSTDPPRVEVDAESVIGAWDATMIEQIVTQLVGNAVKFGGQEVVTVTVRRSGASARLVVTDRGVGVAPEDQLRIFQRYERAASAKHYGGLGLGLWLVRELCESMGGQVSVESRPGAGATFTVELPLT